MAIRGSTSSMAGPRRSDSFACDGTRTRRGSRRRVFTPLTKRWWRPSSGASIPSFGFGAACNEVLPPSVAWGVLAYRDECTFACSDPTQVPLQSSSPRASDLQSFLTMVRPARERSSPCSRFWPSWIHIHDGQKLPVAIGSCGHIQMRLDSHEKVDGRAVARTDAPYTPCRAHTLATASGCSEPVSLPRC